MVNRARVNKLKISRKQRGVQIQRLLGRGDQLLQQSAQIRKDTEAATSELKAATQKLRDLEKRLVQYSS